MDAFTNLQKYYGGDVAMVGKVTPTIRTDPDHVVEDTEIVQLKKNEEAKAAEDAVATAIDHGFDPDSPEGQKKIRQILEGIRQKHREASTTNTKSIENFEKARPRENKSPYLTPGRGEKYASSDPDAAKQAWGIVFSEDPSLKGDVREEAKADWRPGMGPKPRGSRAWAKFSAIFERLRGGKQDKDSEKAIMNMEKAHVSPQLARLLSAAAGWALSGDVAGKVDPHLAQEWDRTSSMHDKRKLQEEMIRQMRRMHRKPQSKLMIIQRKSDDGNFLDNAPAMHRLAMFYKEDDELEEGTPYSPPDVPNPEYEFNEFGEATNWVDDEATPQWDGWAKDSTDHYMAGEAGWGGKEHDMEDYHPESGQLTVPGQGANHVQEWAKGVQAQTGVPLVGGPTGKEPHDDIYKHYGIEGGHMSQKPITAQHIADYVQNKTGQSVSLPGTPNSSVQQMIKQFLLKDHAPVPPRQGLLWDAVKHRWTRPEKVGRTVWEVQGHKRFRGTGSGAHERSRKTGGSGGYGVGSTEAGRRFRSVGDAGRAHPHETKHPGQRDLQSFKRAIMPKRR